MVMPYRVQWSLLAVLLLAAGLTGAVERPKKPPRQRPEEGTFQPVPVGAIKIPLAHVEQPDGWSCGAACLMSVCSYYNRGPKTLHAFKEALHSNPDDGTYYGEIVRYAKQLGLTAVVEKPMSFDRLKCLLDQGKPVICSIQAYSEDDRPDYTTDENGHYVVAIGYDEAQTFYFMDPSANYEGAVANPRYGCLSKAEFDRRWHEDEGIKGAHEPYRKLGIVIYPAVQKGGPLLRARKIE